VPICVIVMRNTSSCFAHCTKLLGEWQSAGSGLRIQNRKYLSLQDLYAI